MRRRVIMQSGMVNPSMHSRVLKSDQRRAAFREGSVALPHYSRLGENPSTRLMELNIVGHL